MRRVDIYQNVLNKELSTACSVNDLYKIEISIGKGADVHYNYEYPLWCACNYGHLDVVKHLINKYNCKVTYGILTIARYNKNKSIVKYLIDIDKGNEWNCYDCLKQFSCERVCGEYRNESGYLK